MELYNHTGHFADSNQPFDRPAINLVKDASHASTVALLHTLLVDQFEK